MDTRSVDEAFAQAIKKKIFSGAQLLVGQNHRQVFFKNYGTLSFEPGAAPLRADSIFDVASLTKPVVTTTLFLLAVEAGQVKLGDPVKKFLPAFNRAEPITLEHLLGHDSGLPAWLPLYEDIPPGEADYPKIRDRFIGRINGVALEAPLAAKRIYSDLGFILLGFILEAVAGRRLDEIFRKEIAEPLGLKRSCFNPCLPPTRISPQEIVSTEDCPRRKKLLSGEVHDDNAYALGGVAGHAGLFSSAPDLQGFIEFLWEVWEGKSSLLRRESLLEFIGEQRPRRLGWDTVSAGSSQAGKYFSAAALGHLAFTGCSLWLDPLNKKSVTLLTNRVHPSRENEAIKDFRPMIHDKILELTGLAG